MDARHFTHLRRLARIFWAYKTGATRVPPLPVRLWIESTSRCNLRCGYCPNKDIEKADHGFMDLDLFKSIIDQVADHAYDVNLFHRGEPTMHPRLPEMVAYARQKGLYTRIHTNITLLSEKKARALLDAGLDYMSCSFDGYTKEMYEKNRVGAKFDWALDHLRRFLELKKAAGARHPFTVLQVMEIGAPPRDELRRMRRAFLAPQLGGGRLHPRALPRRPARGRSTVHPLYFPLVLLDHLLGRDGDSVPPGLLREARHGRPQGEAAPGDLERHPPRSAPHANGPGGDSEEPPLLQLRPHLAAPGHGRPHRLSEDLPLRPRDVVRVAEATRPRLGPARPSSA
jgi:organic radical activating enzyme